MAVTNNDRWRRLVGAASKAYDTINAMRNTDFGKWASGRTGPNAVWGKRIKKYEEKNFGTRRPRPKMIGRGGKSRPRKMKKGKGGGDHGPIKKVRKGRKVTPQDPMKVTLKNEFGVTNQAWHCSYPGAVTHTTQITLLMVCLSIVRFMFKQVGINFYNFFDPLQVLPASTAGTYQILVLYKRETGFQASNTDQLKEELTLNNTDTFYACAVKLAEGLIKIGQQPLGSSVTRLTQISIGNGPITEGQTIVIPTRSYNPAELVISVKGESALQVQNRTAADGGGDQLDASNIFANPLRGKYYTFKRGRPVIRTAGAELVRDKLAYFPYRINSGTIDGADSRTIGNDRQSVFTTNIREDIRKPPAGVFFENCDTSKYMTLLPGAVARSKCVAVEAHTLSTWFTLFEPKFTQCGANATFATLNQNDDPLTWKVGKAHMYGLEKLCDTDVVNNNQITVGLEHNIFMVGKCYYRPKAHAVALVSVNTGL